MSSVEIPFKLYAEELGAFTDTIRIYSNDIDEPIYYIPVSAILKPIFKLLIMKIPVNTLNQVPGSTASRRLSAPPAGTPI
jgi:hypothetical protein